MKTRAFHPADTDAVVALWHACGLVRPWNDPYKDIARKAKVQPELFLVGELDGAVIATAMGGYDGHRGFVYYMAVSPEHQGKRCGATLLGQLETMLLAMGCPKINLMVRAGNPVADFYNALGYSLEPPPATASGSFPTIDAYSTVTDLAKFLGWSTSVPMKTAV